ncbi:hypothetical protein INR49_006522, partial [Caranx melampygus]
VSPCSTDSQVVGESERSREQILQTLSDLSRSFQDIADRCLLVLHLEVRVHCFHYLIPLTKQGNYAIVANVESMDYDPLVVKLNKDISAIEEAMGAALQQHKFQYIFEGLGHLISCILINGAQYFKRISESGIKKMCRNIFVLQQNLTNITMSREADLDFASAVQPDSHGGNQCTDIFVNKMDGARKRGREHKGWKREEKPEKKRQYYEMLYNTADELLNLVVDQGVRYTELEYINALSLLHRSQTGVGDLSTQNIRLQRLKEIICEQAAIKQATKDKKITTVCCTPGTLNEAPAAEASSCGELEESRDMEKQGVLTAELVSSCVTHLGRLGTGLQHSYHQLSLPSHNLSDISVLCNYVHLQKLEVPHNKIKDLSCVNNMPYLVILDASHNEISNFFGFQPPKNLKEVNFSHNRLTKMKDLSAYSSLSKLDLDHNSFREITGLEQCCNLTHLSLANNKISRMSGLDNLPLTHLCLHGPVSQPVSQPITTLTQSFKGPAQSPNPTDSSPLPGNILGKSRARCGQIDNNFTENQSGDPDKGGDPTSGPLRGNQLERIEGLENQRSLQVLDLSLNRITSLSGLQNLHLVGSINLEKNLITEIQECKHIHDLLLLRDLNLLGNPVQEQQDYRLSVVFLLQHLTVLDQEKVSAEEKVSSVNKYDPPMDVVAARNHMTHLLYQLMQPQMLYDSTLPSADSPYPMLVLTGPQGCGKRELAHRLCQELSEYFAYGSNLSHHKGPYFGEENGVDYHFVSEEDFQGLIHMGKFIQTMHYGGHSYGLTRDAIEDVAREGLACCVHMELEGVFTLKNSYFEPRYILLIPTQVEKYMGNLKSRDLYTEAQIDMAVSRIELYANTNRQRPGFFDNVIPCADDWEEAFQTLKRVVREYLLLEEQEGESNSNRASPDNISTASSHEPGEKPPSPLSRSGSGTLTLRSATALDPSDPTYRNYITKIQAELSPEKSLTELASIRRREQLVREAIVGKSPGVYSQLFKSSPQTAPSLQQHHDPGAHFSEDSSSSDESRASSALSVLSSAGALSGVVEPLDMSVLGQALEALKDQIHDVSHPDTDGLAAVVSPSSDRRPGSNIKPILPPIPAGRKTPAAPSPAPSPRPGPSAAVADGGCSAAASTPTPPPHLNLPTYPTLPYPTPPLPCPQTFLHSSKALKRKS